VSASPSPGGRPTRLDGHTNFGGKLPTRATDVPTQRAAVASALHQLAPYLLGLRSADGRHDGDFGEGNAHATVLAEAVQRSTLYYVESDLCDLITHAWPSIPATTLTPELVPDESGFVMFAREMHGLDADHPEYVLRFHALLWTWVDLTVTRERAISIIMFALADTIWSPLGRTDWPIYHDTDEAFLNDDMTDLNREQRIASQTEDRRLLATLWQLASQQRVVDERLAVVMNKGARRRFQREHGRPPAPVRVIDVRRPPRQRSDDPEHRHVEWTRRWIVEGHWRQQAYGEGRALRRPTWIAPFVKGPADRPLVVTERVKRVT
jgi:hypothetical protein